MHRLGFIPSDIKSLATHLTSNSFLKVMTVFTHLVASEDEKHDLFTKQQITIFEECAQLLENALGYKFYKHIANTSAISRHVQQKMDMVRLGIGLYGIDSNKAMQKKLQKCYNAYYYNIAGKKSKSWRNGWLWKNCTAEKG